jgi:hypothetical protein
MADEATNATNAPPDALAAALAPQAAPDAAANATNAPPDALAAAPDAAGTWSLEAKSKTGTASGLTPQIEAFYYSFLGREMNASQLVFRLTENGLLFVYVNDISQEEAALLGDLTQERNNMHEVPLEQCKVMGLYHIRVKKNTPPKRRCQASTRLALGAAPAAAPTPKTAGTCALGQDAFDKLNNECDMLKAERDKFKIECDMLKIEVDHLKNLLLTQMQNQMK